MAAAGAVGRAARCRGRRLPLPALRWPIGGRVRLGHVGVALALVLSLANPWMVLQSLAWAGMLVKYSQRATLVEAVQMTFDNQHPCSLCKEIKAGQAKERQQHTASVPVGKELKLDFPPPAITLLSPPLPGVSPDAPLLPRARCETPPTPPPRLA